MRSSSLPFCTEVHMIYRHEILMGREKEYALTPALENNLAKLLIALNKFRKAYGKPMYVSSGWRPGHYNSRVGGSKYSAHRVCMAADFRDGDKALKKWILANPQILEECGLYMEHPSYTPTWLHLTIRPVASGNRIFIPY